MHSVSYPLRALIILVALFIVVNLVLVWISSLYSFRQPPRDMPRIVAAIESACIYTMIAILFSLLGLVPFFERK